jgi:hypothetical protein
MKSRFCLKNQSNIIHQWLVIILQNNLFRVPTMALDFVLQTQKTLLPQSKECHNKLFGQAAQPDCGYGGRDTPQ